MKENRLYKISSYEDGKQVGVEKEYSVNGNLYSEVNYKDGLLHGETNIYWTETGTVQNRNIYENGKRELA